MALNFQKIRYAVCVDSADFTLLYGSCTPPHHCYEAALDPSGGCRIKFAFAVNTTPLFINN